MMLRFLIFAALANAAAAPNAQAQNTTTELGAKLSECVKQAIEDYPGPDFSERYAAIEVCKRNYPYEYDPSKTGSSLAVAPPAVDYDRMRTVAEARIRSQLVDPGSADFEWPSGFIQSSWKPFLKKRINGYVTCGFVNAKNRMGGYAGRSAFVVVMNDYQVSFVDIDEGGTYDMVSEACEKSYSAFPAPQGETRSTQSSAGIASVADELEKLADLRDRGIVTEEEFQARKAKLLAM